MSRHKEQINNDILHTLQCTNCGEWKPANDDYFYFSFTKDRFLRECILCKQDYYNKNKDRILEYVSEYQSINSKYYANYTKEYERNNKEKTYIKRQRRRSKKRQLPNTLTLEQWENATKFFEYRCAYCGKESHLEQEHFIAISKGGGYTKGNIIPACKSCNSSKGNKHFDEWYPKYKYYSEERKVKIYKYLEIYKDI